MAWDKSTLAFRISWLEGKSGKVERVKKNQSCLRKQNNHTGFYNFLVYLKKKHHILLLKSWVFLAKLTGAKGPWEHFLIFWGKKDIGSVICNTEK